jgi:hypothetical protein
MSDTQLGQIRHALSLIGGFGIAFGWLDSADVEAGTQAVIMVVSAGVAAVAFVSSFLAKRKK